MGYSVLELDQDGNVIDSFRSIIAFRRDCKGRGKTDQLTLVTLKTGGCVIEHNRFCILTEYRGVYKPHIKQRHHPDYGLREKLAREASRKQILYHRDRMIYELDMNFKLLKVHDHSLVNLANTLGLSTGTLKAYLSRSVEWISKDSRRKRFYIYRKAYMENYTFFINQ